MTYHRVCNKSNTTGATCVAETAHPSRAPEFIPCFYWCSCCSIFSFLCNVLLIADCPFVLILLTIVLSVLRFMTSDSPFDIFKLFFANFYTIIGFRTESN